MNNKSGFDLNGYIQALKKDSSELKNSPAVNYVTYHMQTCLEFRKNYQHRGAVKKYFEKNLSIKFFNKGLYLTTTYIFVKFLYLASIFLQIYLLNNWLMDEYYSSSKNWLFGNHNWRLSERFPRKYIYYINIYNFILNLFLKKACHLILVFFLTKSLASSFIRSKNFLFQKKTKIKFQFSMNANCLFYSWLVV